MVVGQSVQAETAGTSALEATPLDGPFGVVVRGIDWDSPCEDEVMLIGRQGDASIPVEEVAQLAGTIPYEVLVNLNERIPREYLGGTGH